MKMDVSEILRGLDGMAAIKESLARRMLVAGGQVMRDEAQQRAPVGDEINGGYARDGKKGSQQPGTLKKSIYLAYSEKRSTDTVFTYSVSWNSKPGSPSNAFWGVMQEFGHKRGVITRAAGKGTTYAVVPYQGGFASLRGRSYTGPNPRFAGASFLGAAFDASLQQVQTAIMAEGRRAFAELVGEQR